MAPAKAEGSYIITWYEGTAVVGPDSARVPDTSREAGSCQVFAQDGEVRPPHPTLLWFSLLAHVQDYGAPPVARVAKCNYTGGYKTAPLGLAEASDDGTEAACVGVRRRQEGAERVEHSTVESGVSVYRRQYFTAYGGPAHSYLSPRIHHATVEGLTGGQRYVYRVSTTGGSSRELSFVAMPQVRRSSAAALPPNARAFEGEL